MTNPLQKSLLISDHKLHRIRNELCTRPISNSDPTFFPKLCSRRYIILANDQVQSVTSIIFFYFSDTHLSLSLFIIAMWSKLCTGFTD